MTQVLNSSFIVIGMNKLGDSGAVADFSNISHWNSSSLTTAHMTANQQHTLRNLYKLQIWNA